MHVIKFSERCIGFREVKRRDLMKYTCDEIDYKLEEIVYGDKREHNRRVFIFKMGIIAVALIFMITVCSFGIGLFSGIFANVPDLSNVSFGPEGYASKAYDTEGNLIATLVQEGSNREEVTYEELPEDLINAFVAIEDQRFWEHNGIDLRSIMRAVRGVITGNDAGGGSTITQQLIKNNILKGGNEDGIALYERKFQEWYIALMIENQPGVDKPELKKQIITDYLNTINLGNNSLGVKVASRGYFDKEIGELNLSECAVLAAITPSPTRYNPITHPEANDERRRLVLKDMLDQGYIDEERYEEAINDDVYSRIAQVEATRESQPSEPYSYFVDELIEQCLEIFKERLGLTEAEARDLLYSGGLTIETTQDPEIQAIVDEEINDPDNYDTAKYSFTWRYSIQHEDGTQTHYNEHHIEDYCVNVRNQRYDGLFRSEEALQSIIDEYKATVTLPTDTVIAENLETTLQPQVSFVLMDQYTKEVKAICGGRGQKKYSRSLNRATNTMEQPGSVFKVISSFAPAMELNGATLGTTYYDCEYTLGEKTFKNWWRSGEYFGYSNIREGIEFSMNIVAVRCMVETVSPSEGVEFARKLGITTLIEEDKNPATALGGLTYGVTNLELTNAFAAIADGGLYGKPKFFTRILDQDGNVLIDLTGDETERVMKETNAFLLTDAMEQSMIYQTKWASGYTVNTTSTRAHMDSMHAAGKSGTTTNNLEVWFVGYSPYLTAGIWAGCDDNQSLNDTTTGVYNGGTSFHKDIWRKIMTRVHEAKSLEDKEFEVPNGIVEIDICRKSGKLPTSACRSDYRNHGNAVYTEYFDEENVPTEYCDHHTSSGRIEVPEEDRNKTTDDRYAGSSSGGSSSNPVTIPTAPVETPQEVPVETAPAEAQPTFSDPSNFGPGIGLDYNYN